MKLMVARGGKRFFGVGRHCDGREYVVEGTFGEASRRSMDTVMSFSGKFAEKTESSSKMVLLSSPSFQKVGPSQTSYLWGLRGKPTSVHPFKEGLRYQCIYRFYPVAICRFFRRVGAKAVGAGSFLLSKWSCRCGLGFRLGCPAFLTNNKKGLIARVVAFPVRRCGGGHSELFHVRVKNL